MYTEQVNGLKSHILQTDLCQSHNTALSNYRFLPLFTALQKLMIRQMKKFKACLHLNLPSFAIFLSFFNFSLFWQNKTLKITQFPISLPKFSKYAQASKNCFCFILHTAISFQFSSKNLLGFLVPFYLFISLLFFLLIVNF